jgi:hypothetical protein
MELTDQQDEISIRGGKLELVGHQILVGLSTRGFSKEKCLFEPLPQHCPNFSRNRKTESRVFDNTGCFP